MTYLNCLGTKEWKLTYEYDPNHGGDGARIRLFGYHKDVRPNSTIMIDPEWLG